jgi:hypothetical protein
LSCALASCEDFPGLKQGPDTGFLNMIKKLVLAAAVAAVAVSFAPTASHAKKMHKMKPCTMGTMASGPANSMGWAPVMGCGMDGKMYPMLMMCYMGSQLCPPSM